MTQVASWCASLLGHLRALALLLLSEFRSELSAEVFHLKHLTNF